MSSAIGHLENGIVRLDEPTPWSNGQTVIVVALPLENIGTEEPPPELLEEDAREFAVRREVLADINRRELT
jgi:hypothetical protein